MVLDDLVLEIQTFLGKTFGVPAYAMTTGNIIDAAIALPLLAFVFYNFLNNKVRPFKGTSNSVYAVIATAFAGMLALQGGFLFTSGKLIAALAIPAAAALSNWGRKTQIRFVSSGWILLIVFYIFFGNFQSGLNILRPAIGLFALVNIFFSDMPLSSKIFLAIMVLAFVVFFWSQILSLFSVSEFSTG